MSVKRFKYIRMNENRINVVRNNSCEDFFGRFFRTPGRNWFFESSRELTYLELRVLANKLYHLSRREKLGLPNG